MNVVVGKALKAETPVIGERMRSVVFRPYWNIPPSIALEETLPAVVRSGSGSDPGPATPSGSSSSSSRTTRTSTCTAPPRRPSSPRSAAT
jgi:hypothetical protein